MEMLTGSLYFVSDEFFAKIQDPMLKAVSRCGLQTRRNIHTYRKRKGTPLTGSVPFGVCYTIVSNMESIVGALTLLPSLP